MSKHVVVDAGLDILKVAASVVVAVVGAECAFMGTKMAEADGDFIKAEVKYHTNPDPVYVKKGRFGKKKVVKVSPTGKIEEYTGKKTPVSKKAYRI